MLGHHSWEFTASTYLHLDDDDLPAGSLLEDLVAEKVLAPGAFEVREDVEPCLTEDFGGIAEVL